MTLVGYFNSLRELGGMRHLVGDEVRNRVGDIEAEKRPALYIGPHPWAADRRLEMPAELTSREPTERVKDTKRRLSARRTSKDPEPLDVVLASNMISVGLDIDRLGLMVVTGQPKTTSEYIQATSRVGRSYPGLVVVCLNVMRPRDRSHYERFVAYHESFYREVEATSVTPFSGQALDRGLVGTLLSMVRHALGAMQPPVGFMQLHVNRPAAEQILAWMVARAAYLARHLGSFVSENWPFGDPHPHIYYDKRALQPGPPFCSLHAKCVVVDGAKAFVSSANFTQRGHERNIEVGVLIEDTSFASFLAGQWLGLVEGAMVGEFRCGQ